MKPANQQKLPAATMLNFVITFLLLAIVSVVFGFDGLAGLSAIIAKILSISFIVLFIGSLVYGLIAQTHNKPFI